MDTSSAALDDLFDRSGRPIDLVDGDMLISEGAAAHDVYRIDSGLLKVTAVSAAGREVVIEFLCTGQIVGEMAALLAGPRSASVFAVGPAQCTVLPMRAFTQALGEADFAVAVAERLAAKLARASAHQLEMGAFDATSRVAAVLLRLGTESGRRVEEGVMIDRSVTQQDLADYAGFSRDAVVRALRTLRASGWIETGRQSMVLRDLDSLRLLCAVA